MVTINSNNIHSTSKAQVHRSQYCNLIMSRSCNPHSKTTTAYCWNHTRWWVATQNETTSRTILLHRTSQRMLCIFRQPINFRQ